VKAASALGATSLASVNVTGVANGVLTVDNSIDTIPEDNGSTADSSLTGGEVAGTIHIHIRYIYLHTLSNHNICYLIVIYIKYTRSDDTYYTNTYIYTI
jgi:hypothetical protein